MKDKYDEFGRRLYKNKNDGAWSTPEDYDEWHVDHDRDGDAPEEDGEGSEYDKNPPLERVKLMLDELEKMLRNDVAQVHALQLLTAINERLESVRNDIEIEMECPSCSEPTGARKTGEVCSNCGHVEVPEHAEDYESDDPCLTKEERKRWLKE